MSGKLSKANMIRYDVENFIARKCELLYTLETEIAVLSVDPAQSRRVAEEIRKNRESRCYRGTLPSNPEAAKRFLEDCERFAKNPTTTPTE